MKTVSLAREAAGELASAAAWYDEQRPGLGGVFLDHVEGLLTLIGERPASFPRLACPAEPLVRRALLSRFPYALVFLELEDRVRVLAIAHVKREPGYWLHRLA